MGIALIITGLIVMGLHHFQVQIDFRPEHIGEVGGLLAILGVFMLLGWPFKKQ